MAHIASAVRRSLHKSYQTESDDNLVSEMGMSSPRLVSAFLVIMLWLREREWSRRVRRSE